MDGTAEFLQQEGNRLFRQGEIDRSIEFYTQALSQAPSNPILLSNRAAAYSKKSPPDWHKSYNDAKAATAEDPGLWKAWSRLGLASLNLERPREALVQYRRAEAEFKKVEGDSAVVGISIRDGLEKAKRKVDELEEAKRKVDELEAAARQRERIATSSARSRVSPPRRPIGNTPFSVNPVRVPFGSTQTPGPRNTPIASNSSTHENNTAATWGRPTLASAFPDFLASDLPPEYIPNINHPDPAVRRLSQQQILNQLTEIEEQLLVRNKGALLIDPYFDLEGYEHISVLYKGMVAAELTSREHGYPPLKHPSFGITYSAITNNNS
jgi:hypothetical protein